MDLVAGLGNVIVNVLKTEAKLIKDVKTNWWDGEDKTRKMHGLPGRREAHLVAIVAAHLRHRGYERLLLDDDYLGGPVGRQVVGRQGRQVCDLRIELSEKNQRKRWFWVEFKTMPFEDAQDKLLGLHGDLVKLEAAARTPGNLPQAVAAIGFDRLGTRRIDIETRLRHFAVVHGLDRWPYRLGREGVRAFWLPLSTQNEWYTRCVVGYWARTSAKKSPARVPEGKWYLVGKVRRWAAAQGL